MATISEEVKYLTQKEMDEGIINDQSGDFVRQVQEGAIKIKTDDSPEPAPEPTPDPIEPLDTPDPIEPLETPEPGAPADITPEPAPEPAPADDMQKALELKKQQLEDYEGRMSQKDIELAEKDAKLLEIQEKLKLSQQAKPTPAAESTTEPESEFILPHDLKGVSGDDLYQEENLKKLMENQVAMQTQLKNRKSTGGSNEEIEVLKTQIHEMKEATRLANELKAQETENLKEKSHVDSTYSRIEEFQNQFKEFKTVKPARELDQSFRDFASDMNYILIGKRVFDGETGTNELRKVFFSNDIEAKELRTKLKERGLSVSADLQKYASILNLRDLQKNKYKDTVSLGDVHLLSGAKLGSNSQRDTEAAVKARKDLLKAQQERGQFAPKAPNSDIAGDIDARQLSQEQVKILLNTPSMELRKDPHKWKLFNQILEAQGVGAIENHKPTPRRTR